MEAAAGRILPPYMEIEYRTLGREEDFDQNKRIPMSFKFIYHANISQVCLRVIMFASVYLGRREIGI